MRAEEIESIATAYQDPSQDKFTQRHINDTRKQKLTLRHLNKLKKMRAARDLENLMRADTLDIIYTGAGEGEGGAIPGGL